MPSLEQIETLVEAETSALAKLKEAKVNNVCWPRPGNSKNTSLHAWIYVNKGVGQ